MTGVDNLVVSSAGDLYVADTANHTIRRIVAGGGVNTMAGGAGDDVYHVDSQGDVVDDDRAGYLTGGGGGIV